MDQVRLSKVRPRELKDGLGPSLPNLMPRCGDTIPRIFARCNTVIGHRPVDQHARLANLLTVVLQCENLIYYKFQPIFWVLCVFKSPRTYRTFYKCALHVNAISRDVSTGTAEQFLDWGGRVVSFPGAARGVGATIESPFLLRSFSTFFRFFLNFFYFFS